MFPLSQKHLTQKLDFIQHYLSANNAADGSWMDANANVTEKNIATMGKTEPLKRFDLPGQQLITLRVKGAAHLHSGTNEGSGSHEVKRPPCISRILRYPLLLHIEALPD